MGEFVRVQILASRVDLQSVSGEKRGRRREISREFLLRLDVTFLN